MSTFSAERGGGASRAFCVGAGVKPRRGAGFHRHHSRPSRVAGTLTTGERHGNRRMTPVDHSRSGFGLAALVFFGGFFAFAAVAFVPLGGPPLLLRLAGALGDSGWGVYPALFFAAFALSVGGAELVRWAYRRRVPAACPRCGG